MLADDPSGDFGAIADCGFAQRVPRLPRQSSLMARLDAGHTVALDDPIAAARFLAEEVEFWRDLGIYYFVPCVFEGGAIAVLALGRKETRRAVQQRGPGAADGRGRPGGDGARERPPLPAAAPEGGRARPDARVQREHPRVARQRAGRVRRGRADRALEPRARVVLRPAPARRPSAGRSPRSSICRSSTRSAPRSPRIPTARRSTACRSPAAWPRPERLLVNATAVPLEIAERRGRRGRFS